MLLSLSFILLFGLLLGKIFSKFRMPPLMGMLITGIILGPHVLDLIDGSILNISTELRQAALVIILIRAGLALNIKDLKSIGRLAVLMSFLPSCFEIGAVMLIAPKLFGISIIEAGIMGSVLAAVSPAVIVPKMLQLAEEHYGTKKRIPKIIMAGASLDNIFAILMFAFFMSLAGGEHISVKIFVEIPALIVTGLLIGMAVGFLLVKFFKAFHIRDTVKMLIILSVSFIFVAFESKNIGIMPFYGLVAIMSIGIATVEFYPVLAERLSFKFSKLWVIAEILLFVLIGASVGHFGDILLSAGKLFLLLFFALLLRLIGVFISLAKSRLLVKEKLFCMIAYIPKATVQAAIGTIPAAMGFSCGQTILAVAVTAILITAPLGAIGIDLSYKKLLEKFDGHGSQ